MNISITVPTRGSINNIKGILDSLFSQTKKSFVCYFLIDSTLDENSNLQYIDLLNSYDLDIIDKIKFISNLNSDFVPHCGVSYVRNYLVNLVDKGFLFMVDDDNRFNATFLQDISDAWESLRMWVGKDYLIGPTIMYRDSGKVVNQGFEKFNYFLSRPVVNRINNKSYTYVQMYGGNSLFGPVEIFRKIKYDNRIDFVYEDLDFAMRATSSGYPILVLANLKIYHYEVDKTPLQHAFVGDEKAAYRKGKHRFILVNNSAKFYEKIAFYIIGVPFQTIRLTMKILIKGINVDRFSIIKSYLKGTLDGYLKKY